MTNSGISTNTFKVNFKLAPLGLVVLTGPDGMHIVSEISDKGQASKHDVRTNDIVILVNDKTIDADLSHDRFIELFFNQNKDFSMTFQRPEKKSRENAVVHFEKGSMGLMIEGKMGEIRVKNIVIGGQAHSKGVVIGDVLSGIGHTHLYGILQEPDSTEALTTHFKEMMEANRPIVVNFNGIATTKKKAVAKKAHSAAPPPAAKSPPKQDELASFKKLMIKGLEVNKIHSNPPPCRAKFRVEILYMDVNLTRILCSTNKGTDRRNFLIQDIVQLRPVAKKPRQLTIIGSGNSKGELTVEVPSENARNLIMQRLAQLIKEQKALRTY